jgi:hypothetical protein
VTDSLLMELVGDSLASVVFVMDYVQLDFNGSRFTGFVWPTVTIGATELHFGDEGYRDALCAFITHEVTSAAESADVGLAIHFALGSIVTNPERGEVRGPEIAMLSIYDPMYDTKRWDVWRPGEGPFADRDWS